MLTAALHELSELLSSWSSSSVFLRLLLATIVGIVIGSNREWNNKMAGVKTYVLVCVGSAMAMIIGEYVLHEFPQTNVDVTRIGAQVVSGVGFLGVGTIIVTKRNRVRGLSTAAGLWACSCIGLAAGIGYLFGTLAALFFVLLTFFALNQVDRWLRQASRTFDIYVEFRDTSDVREFLRKLHAWEVIFEDFVLTKSEAGLGATLTIKMDAVGRKDLFINSVQALECVVFVIEI